MIKCMLKTGCSPNAVNDQLATPFGALLNKLDGAKFTTDFIEMFLEAPKVNTYGNEITKMLENRGYKIPPKPDSEKNLNFMIQTLNSFNENNFIREFGKLKTSTTERAGDLQRLLEEVIIRNMSGLIEFLLENGADANRMWKFDMTPAFLACTLGHHESLSCLLSQEDLSFMSSTTHCSLLHQILRTKNVDENDRKKCFDLVINDRRCTDDIINSIDEDARTPLFYACYNGLRAYEKTLIQKHADISDKSVMDLLNKEVLEEILDESIKCTNDIEEKSCEIHVDYNFLMPPKICEKLHFETRQASLISENSNLTELVLHPVIFSFVVVKWKKINFIVYVNLLLYFSFMFFLGSFTINLFGDPSYQCVDRSEIAVIPRAAGFAKVRNSSTGLFSRLFKKPKERVDKESGNFSIDYVDLQETSTPNENEEVQFNNILENETFVDDNAQYFVDISLGGPDEFQNETIDEAQNSTEKKIYKIKSWTNNFSKYIDKNYKSFMFCVAGVACMAIFEAFQCVTAFKSYFSNFENLLDISLIYLSYIVFFENSSIEPENFRKIRAFIILVMAAQCYQLISKVSFLSISLYMAIFKQVLKTFLKTIALYFVMILAFAMCFYTLNGQKKEDTSEVYCSDDDDLNSDSIPILNKIEGKFTNVFTSIVITVRMMLADFDAAKFDDKDQFEGYMFLLFVVLITIVLFNLLNALAISDTNEIIKHAELVEIREKIAIINVYEKIFSFLHIRFATNFPEMTSIVLRPNKDDIVRMEQKCNVTNEQEYKAAKYWDLMTAVGKKEEKIMRMNSAGMSKMVDFVKNQQESQANHVHRNVVSEKFDVLFEKINLLQKALDVKEVNSKE